jgi:metallo-beta-lactamase class B
MNWWARPAVCVVVSLAGFVVHAQDREHGEQPKLMNSAAMGVGGSEHEAFQIFDNLYYVGINFVSAYVVPTSDGLILIDTTYDNTVDHVVAGMKSFGLDPAAIKYILVTHWHSDHLGGADKLQAMSGATVGMINADWDSRFIRHSIPEDRIWRIHDGEKLTLGDTTMEFFHTPGHTEGVLSIAFTVYDNRTPHRAFTFGGTGLNFSGLEPAKQYLASIERIQKMQGIEINVANHESMGRIFERAEELKRRTPGGPHPFVDPDGFTSWLNTLHDAGEAKLEREKARAAAR